MSLSWIATWASQIALDIEHILPMEYGFTVRFRDYEDMLAYQPRMLEFHFTDQDLDEHYPGDDFSASSTQPLKLVVHAPEFWDRTLVDLCCPGRAPARGFARSAAEDHQPDA